MPSLLHEAPLELLRRNPGLAAAMLTGIPGVAVPEGGPASLAPGEVTASLPVELRADAVVLLAGSADLRDPVVQVRTLEQLAGLDAETLATYTRIVLMAAPDKSS
ncbi:MAG TPA: hypothetical protein VMC83_17235 [Streptosporangiaceae bacterium]|nr:hypothetical protein [Streptosporangiaceae bacterium]